VALTIIGAKSYLIGLLQMRRQIVAAQASNKATAQRTSSGHCGWRELDAREREFLARTQSRLSPVGDARAPRTLPHPLARVVLNLGGSTQEHAGFDPSNGGV
jgi:hypothetical protein